MCECHNTEVCAQELDSLSPYILKHLNVNHLYLCMNGYYARIYCVRTAEHQTTLLIEDTVFN